MVRKHKKLILLIIIIVVALVLIIYPRITKTSAEKLAAPVFNQLGNFNWPISTKIAMAQKYFNQGIVLYYGFEWGESIRSFQAATKLDPKCGMCYWGLALALGSKMNAPMSGNEYQDAKTAIQKALALKQFTSPAEQAYIKALSLRFQHPPKKSKVNVGIFSCHLPSNNLDNSSPDEISNYAAAMKKLSNTYPSDNNAKALTAYAFFDRIKWAFWDVNGKINSLTPTLINLLKSIIKNDELNIGGNHYYIHVIEQSPHPEDALASADRLRTLVPDSEHLVHMPTHIYFLTGRYHQATEANEQAIEAFNNYDDTCRTQGFEPEINYLYMHNYDFLRTTATMEGRRQLALSAARNMLKPPFANWLANDLSLQLFIPIPFYIETRFGLWDAILKEQQPETKYQYAIGMWHYARGMAFAHTDKIEHAKKELAALSNIIKKGPDDSVLQKNGLKLLTIAEAVLKGTLADQQDDQTNTFNFLKTAVKIQHDMGYHEPPDWYFPVKQALADAYLKWGKYSQAITFYQQDLKQYPNNGWALFGLAKSLEKAGQQSEADKINQAFKNAWSYADIAEPIQMFK